MTIFLNNSKNILYIHVPKTGGEFISEQLSKYGLKTFHSKKAEMGNNVVSQHLAGKQILDSIKKSGIKNCELIVMTVRNPYDRLISEFVWQWNLKDYINRTGFDSRFFIVLEKFAIHRLSAYKVNEMQFRLDPAGFMNKGTSFVFDNHLRPQHHFVTNDWNIYWYEEMDRKFWPDISNKYGVEPSGHFNVGVDKKFGRPSKHLGTNNKFKDLFVELYYEDCKLFGYELPF